MKLSQDEKIKIAKMAYDSVATGQSKTDFAKNVCRLFGLDFSFDLYMLAMEEHQKQRKNFEECNF
ncbi:MAG: hypothetical protein KBT03_09375 [Bacteroidales bacterium]|nr:hypothetical protein [Candidatus Scybalousia scybalohippi]